MSAKYTPGPWKVEYGQDSGRPLGIFAPGDAGIPGAVGCVVRRNGIGMPSSPVAEANARLIAKAPEFVKVLRRLAHDTEELGCTCADRIEGHQPYCTGMSLTEQARALLAEIDGAE